MTKKQLNRVLPLTEQNVHILFNLVNRLGVPKTIIWLKTKNLNLGGISPINLIHLDRGHKVLEFIIATGEE